MQQEIIKAFNWRSAVKIFQKDKLVSADRLETILEAARLSPSAYGIQPVRIVEVKNIELKERIKLAAFGQAQVVDAPHLFVICIPAITDADYIHKYVELVSNEREVDMENLKGFENMMVGDIVARSEESKFAWAGRQAYIALGAMLETAALLEVDAGPMEGFLPNKVNEILGLEKLSLTSVGMIVLGYRDEADTWSKSKKVRFPKSEFVIGM